MVFNVVIITSYTIFIYFPNFYSLKFELENFANFYELCTYKFLI